MQVSDHGTQVRCGQLDQATLAAVGASLRSPREVSRAAFGEPDGPCVAQMLRELGTTDSASDAYLAAELAIGGILRSRGVQEASAARRRRAAMR